MAKVTARVAVRWRWWFPAYMACLRVGVAVTGLEPNWDRVEWWIRRGLVARVDRP